MAVAAGLCAGALGSDTGGSIRGPAAFCGIVGMRPTYGRVSRHGVKPMCWSMDTVGPMTRTVRDYAIMLAAIAGRDERDTTSSRNPVPDYLAELDAGVEGLRIGVVTERIDYDGVDPQVRDAVTQAIGLLGELGAEVQEVSIPLMPDSAAVSTAIIYPDAATVHRQGIEEHLSDYDHNIRVRLLAGSILPAQAHQKAQRLRHLLRQQVLEALERVDVLVMPTAPTGATLLPTAPGVASKEEFLEMLGGRRSYTAPFNLASVPAISINCGFTSESLPVGLQIAGRPFEESTVFRAARAYEQATDWGRRRPPL